MLFLLKINMEKWKPKRIPLIKVKIVKIETDVCCKGIK